MRTETSAYVRGGGGLGWAGEPRGRGGAVIQALGSDLRAPEVLACCPLWGNNGSGANTLAQICLSDQPPKRLDVSTSVPGFDGVRRVVNSSGVGALRSNGEEVLRSGTEQGGRKS